LACIVDIHTKKIGDRHKKAFWLTKKINNKIKKSKTKDKQKGGKSKLE